MNYFITGATGFIGSAVVHYIIETVESANLFLLVRNKEQAEVMFKEYENRITLIEGDLETLPKLILAEVDSVDYIIHCAAPTQSTYMISQPVETADAIVLGTRNILDLARKYAIRSMLYVSSMEVYGVVEDIGRPRTESELGNIDIFSVRSCYSMGKRMAEHYCKIYQKEYGVPVKIARLAQTFGVGVKYTDNRVFMQFAKAVIEKNNIVLTTDGSSIGNYCSTEDAVNAIWAILKDGDDGEVYNVVNEDNTMSIREMAEFVARQLAKDKIKVLIQLEDESKTGYAPKTNLRMSSEKLRALGWKPSKGLKEMYEDIICTVKAFY